MADDTTSPQPRDERGERPGGGRPPGNREPGGFRIRLSDNELRAARAIQEGFGLRSTVAALGFAIRTVAQLLEEGQLDALVAQQRAQAGNRGGDAPRGEASRGDRRPGPADGRGSRQERSPRIDPFARPSKPAAPATPEVADELPASEPTVETSQDIAETAAIETSAIETASIETPADLSPDTANPESSEN